MSLDFINNLGLGQLQIEPPTEQATREQAMRERTTREQATRAQVTREQVTRERTTWELTTREQVMREQVSWDQASREQVKREQATRERTTREQVTREQATRERATREQPSREQGMREQAAREQATREQASREQVTREQATRAQANREQTTREQATREQATREQATREQATREQPSREQPSREQVTREQVTREQVTREQGMREQAAREQATRKQASREQVMRDQAMREQATREQASREQVTRDQAMREQATREQATREQTTREQVMREQLTREQASREQATREQAMREQSSREQASREQVTRERTTSEQATREHATREQASLFDILIWQMCTEQATPNLEKRAEAKQPPLLARKPAFAHCAEPRELSNASPKTEEARPRSGAHAVPATGAELLKEQGRKKMYKQADLEPCHILNTTPIPDPRQRTKTVYEPEPFSRKSELRIVLVGKTGVGKSATGNTILGGQASRVMSSSDSVTQKCYSKKGSYEGRKLVIIDTPGLFDTSLSHEDTAKEIGRCIAMSTPGPHALVLVLHVGCFTQEEKDAVEKIQDIFGTQAMKYMIVLFTRKDDLVNDNKTIQDYINNSTDRSLLRLIGMCENRYCAFDNKLVGEKRQEQVSELITMIDAMVRKNNSRCYTNDMYVQATEMVRTRGQEMKICTEMLEQEIEKLRQECNERVEKLRKDMLRKMKEEIESIIKETVTEAARRQIEIKSYELKYQCPPEQAHHPLEDQAEAIKKIEDIQKKKKLSKDVKSYAKNDIGIKLGSKKGNIFNKIALRRKK